MSQAVIGELEAHIKYISRSLLAKVPGVNYISVKSCLCERLVTLTRN